MLFFGPRLENLDPVEAARASERGELTIVDVRGPAEWRGGVVPGAQLVPLGELRQRLDGLPAGRLAFVCASGHRSASAARRARRAGREVANVAGGMNAWRRAGLKTAKPRPRPST